MRLGPRPSTDLQRGANPKTPGQHRLQIAAGARRQIDDPKATTALGPIREALPASISGRSLPTPRHATPQVWEGLRSQAGTRRRSTYGNPVGDGVHPPGLSCRFGADGWID